jgi:hypothetical protein
MTGHPFPALGFDPAPGSCDALASLARDCGALGVELMEDGDQLRRIADGSAWRGAAADAFRHRLDDLPRDLGRAGDAYQQACSALSLFSLALADAQVTARALEQRAVAGSSSPDLHDSDQLAIEAERLRDQVRADAAACGRALHDATRHAPQPPGWFHRLVDAGVHALSAVNQAVGDFVRAHADVIAAFAGALSKVSSALALVAMLAGPIPVLGQAVGSLAAGGALLTAGMALAGHAALAAYAGGSWTAVAMDGAAVLTGLGPRAVESAAGRVVEARGLELGETTMPAPEALAVLRHPRAGVAAMGTATMTFPELVTRTVSYQFDLAGGALGTVELVREAGDRGPEHGQALGPLCPR